MMQVKIHILKRCMWVMEIPLSHMTWRALLLLQAASTKSIEVGHWLYNCI